MVTSRIGVLVSSWRNRMHKYNDSVMRGLLQSQDSRVIFLTWNSSITTGGAIFEFSILSVTTMSKKYHPRRLNPSHYF